jgi:hypothetical protein
LLPILYFGVAHLALSLAFVAVAVNPRSIAGFFYHSRIVAIVHLVTLGWITSSILGSLYIVGPIALRTLLPATWLDYSAFAVVTTGIVGMVAHFWIEAYSGMAWSAIMVGIGIAMVGWRTVGPIRHAPIPRAVRVHIVLAFGNVLVAAVLGVLIGFDKVYHFLPGFVLSNMAAIGWASMMVVGVAYRLLPMVLPSAMPKDGRLWNSAILLEIGAVGLFVTLLFGSSATWVFALVTVVGFGSFLSKVIWMRSHRRKRPPEARTPDPAVLHAGAAFVSLVIASIIGLWLAVADRSEATLRFAMAYGVFGLVGFLGQMVIGMEGRLLPLFAWYWAYANTNYRGPVKSPHEMPWRGAQDVVFVLWLFGVPSLAGGLTLDAIPFITAGASCLFAATVVDTANVIRILRHAFARVPAAGHGTDVT